MRECTLNSVLEECEAFKTEVEGAVLSAVDLAILEIAFLRGQQSQMEEELVRLEKEVA